MSIDYRPAACRQPMMRRGSALAEAALPYRMRTRGLPNYPVAARRPDGSLITLSDLPDADSRWTRLRKQTVIECLDHGLLTTDAARDRYQLSEPEIGEWRAAIAERGRAPVTWPDRPRRVKTGTIRRDDLLIDLDERVVMLGDELLPLSASEWTVLATIAEADGAIVTSAMIMGALYGDAAKAAGVKIVDVLVCRLRRKLGAAASVLGVVWGRGYYLAD